jgi:hypothetical protein
MNNVYEIELTREVRKIENFVPEIYEKKLEELYEEFMRGLVKWENEMQVTDDRNTYLNPFLKKKSLLKTKNTTF